jgi:hypothetical protein
VFALQWMSVFEGVSYNGLRDMIRNDYSGMLIDVLWIEIEP